MNILIATGMYPPTIGGPATYAKLLHDELPKYDIHVKILSFEWFLKFPKGISQGLYLLHLLMKARGCDIIYALDPVSVGYPAMIAAKLLRKKFVVRIAGDRAWEQGVQQFGITDMLDDFVQPGKDYPPKIMRMKKMQKTVAEAAKKIIVPSQYLKKIIEQWGIEREKIQVIYNAFEQNQVSNFAKPACPADRTTSDRQETERVILSAGRLVKWKGFQCLIESIPSLLEAYPNVKLVIAGDGPEKENLKKRIRELQLEEHVELTGSLPKKELFEYIQSAELFVLNTGYEGFSHQLLEVLALGTPIITTNVGGNPEIITSGENGLLVAYNNEQQLQEAIEGLLADHLLQDRFVQKGKEVVASYTKERMLTGLIKQLKNI